MNDGAVKYWATADDIALCEESSLKALCYSLDRIPWEEMSEGRKAWFERVKNSYLNNYDKAELLRTGTADFWACSYGWKASSDFGDVGFKLAGHVRRLVTPGAYNELMAIVESPKEWPSKKAYLKRCLHGR